MITLNVGTTGFSPFREQSAPPRRASATCVIEIGARPRTAPPPRAQTLVTGLAAPLSDGRRVAGPGLAAVEASRGFALGSGYLTGQIIDRAI